MIGGVTTAVALACSVSTTGGVAGLIREQSVPVTIKVQGDRFAASGHFDLDRLTDQRVELAGGRALLSANYDDLPAAHLKASLGSLEAATTTIEWQVLEATGAPREQVLAGRGSGTCIRQQPEGISQ